MVNALPSLCLYVSVVNFFISSNSLKVRRFAVDRHIESL